MVAEEAVVDIKDYPINVIRNGKRIDRLQRPGHEGTYCERGIE